MDKILDLLVRRPIIGNLITLFLVFGGIFSAYQAKRTAYPEVDFNILLITSYYAGATPQDVELKITDPIEEKIKEVEGLDRYISLSAENFSYIIVWVDLNEKDPDKIADDVRNAVDSVTDLPAGVQKPDVQDLKSTNIPMYSFSILRNDALSDNDLRVHAKAIENKLLTLPSVSKISKTGYFDREIKIEIDPTLLDKFHLTINETANAIRQRNLRVASGQLESPTQSKNIVTLGEFENLLDAKDVIIRANIDGRNLTISDVASVKEGFNLKNKSWVRSNAKPAISFNVYKPDHADIIDAVDIVKNTLEEFKKNLPEGIEIHQNMDLSWYTKNLINILIGNAIMGFILVMATLLVFFHWKIAAWAVIGIPLGFLGSFIFLPHFDVNLNVIALSAMIVVLGMLVDDAILMTENIFRLREEGVDPIQASIQGVKEVFWPVFGTVTTTCIAFIPLLLMTGVMGKFVYSIPIIVIITLSLSLFEAAFILPGHLANSHFVVKEKALWFKKVRTKYEKLLRKALKYRYLNLGFFITAFIGSIILYQTRMNFELFPNADADLFYIILENEIGTNLPENSAKTEAIEKIVATIPSTEMISYMTFVGNNNTDPYYQSLGVAEHVAKIQVNLKPASERRSQNLRTALEIIESIRSQVMTHKEFKKITFKLWEDGPPVGKAIEFNIVDSNDDSRQIIVEKMEAMLQSLPGVSDLESSIELGRNELQIHFDHLKLASFGLTVAEVAQVVRVAFDGEVVSTKTLQDEEIDYRVILNESAKAKAETILELEIRNQQGQIVPLKKFASLVTQSGSANVSHYNGERSVKISGDVNPAITTALQVNEKVVSFFSSLAKEHPSAQLVFGGESKETEESLTSLAVSGLWAVIGVYMILILLFNSLFQPIIVMLAIPFGLIGVIISFYLQNMVIGFMAIIGTIGLSGVVVNNSLVMVDYINKLIGKFNNTELAEQIVYGASMRLRPIFLTTFTTMVGLIPTAYGIGGYEPFIVPMVMAMTWGLFFATIITLFLIPCLYMIGEDVRKLKMSLLGKIKR